MQKTSEKLNFYQIITDSIVANLEKGVLPWEKPWKSPRFARRSLPAQLLYRQILPRYQRHAVMEHRL
jgi:antirestriction protein ArdC